MDLTAEEAQRWSDQQTQIDGLNRDIAARELLQQRDQQIRAMQDQLEPPPRNLGEAMLRATRDAARAAEAERAKQPPQPGIDWRRGPDVNQIRAAATLRGAIENL